MIDLLGGLLGTSLSVLIATLTAAVRDWTPVLDPKLPLLALLLRALIGLIAGTHPSIKTAGIESITALRTGQGWQPHRLLRFLS